VPNANVNFKVKKLYRLRHKPRSGEKRLDTLKQIQRDMALENITFCSAFQSEKTGSTPVGSASVHVTL
jgi:hypothetical protein